MSLKRWISASFLACFVSVTSAQTVPHTFQAGQPARANEINENFEYLLGQMSYLQQGDFFTEVDCSVSSSALQDAINKGFNRITVSGGTCDVGIYLEAKKLILNGLNNASLNVTSFAVESSYLKISQFTLNNSINLYDGSVIIGSDLSFQCSEDSGRSYAFIIDRQSLADIREIDANNCAQIGVWKNSTLNISNSSLTGLPERTLISLSRSYANFSNVSVFTTSVDNVNNPYSINSNFSGLEISGGELRGNFYSNFSTVNFGNGVKLSSNNANPVDILAHFESHFVFNRVLLNNVTMGNFAGGSFRFSNDEVYEHNNVSIYVQDHLSFGGNFKGSNINVRTSPGAAVIIGGWESSLETVQNNMVLNAAIHTEINLDPRVDMTITQINCPSGPVTTSTYCQ